MNILLTNDDGIHAPGLKALAKALSNNGNLCVVAPSNEKSASSHSISLGQKLRVERLNDDRILQYSVSGTPADCVKFALSELQEFKPDLIISGINQGSNTGISVYYSGTISAAREGLINQIPAMAISLCSKTFKDFSASVRVTQSLLEGYDSGVFPKDVVLNVNVPPVPWDTLKGIKVTKQAASRFIEEFIRGKEHDGKIVYELAGEIELYDRDGTSDEEAMIDNFASVTPLKIDLTDYEAMKTLKNRIEVNPSN